MFREVKYLLAKDFKLELRQKHAINGIILYILMIDFVVFLSFQQVEIKVWNTLLWIILLFAAVNAIVKSFVQESRYRDIYYYTLASPQAVILSKMIYNLFLMVFLTFVGLAFYAMILGFPVVNTWVFLGTILLGAAGFSVTFTMVAAIASKASNSTSLMAVLSFPVFIPMLVLLLALSDLSFEPYQAAQVVKNMLILLVLDAIVVVMALVLFPYLWRD